VRSPWRSTIAAALGAASALLVARGASANAAAPYHRNPSAAGGAFVAGQTSLVVEHESLVLDCTGAAAPADVECRFEATYDVANPTDADEEVLGVFFGAPPDEMTVTIDGADVRRAVQHEQVAEAARSIPIDPTDRSDSASIVDERRVTGFAVAIRAHDRRRVRFTGRLEPTYTYQSRDGYALAAIKTRHVFLGGEPRHDKRVEYTYMVSPLRSWGGRPPIDVTVRSSTSWSFAPGDQGFTSTREGGRLVSRLATTAAQTTRLTYAFEIAPPPVYFGGPFVGVGPELEDAGPRLRAGLDVGLGNALIASAAFESFEEKARRSYTLVPALEIATPGVFIIIPSLSAGLGVPVQLHSVGPPRVGARAQVGLAFPLFSLCIPLDVYFDDGARGQIAFMTQLGF
jgi:hypothetical protein